MTKLVSRLLLAVLIMAGLTFGNRTYAQDNADGFLEEILVTAERRSVSLDRTSIAVSVFNAEELQTKGVHELANLQYAAPALTVNEGGFIKRVSMRGVGMTVVSPSVVPGVATYRDGIFLGNGVALDEPFFDIESVEVLRGPQGTFVGQNSTGGAILINTHSANLGGWSGYAQLQAGNYDDWQLVGAINLPVKENMAFRVALHGRSRDSFFNNIGSDTVQPGERTDRNVRVGFYWEPTDSVTVDIKAALNEYEMDGYPFRPQEGTAFSDFAPADVYTLNYDRQDTRNDFDGRRFSADINVELGNSGIVFRSLSGFQDHTQDQFHDIDATMLPPLYTFHHVFEKFLTQEFSLLSSDDKRARWVVGAVAIQGTFTPFLDIFTPGPRIDVDIRTDKDSYGVFGQFDYAINDQFEIQVGARYSWDEEHTVDLIGIDPPGILLPGDESTDAGEPTGKISLNWTPDDDNLVYAFYARGYVSGGTNPGSAPFDAEFLDDYEIGWKTSFLNNRARLQLGAYYMDYKGFQHSVFDPNTTQSSVRNAGDSTIKGAEAQGHFIMGNLSLDFGINHTDSSIGAVELIDTRQLPGGSADGLGPQCPPGTPSNPPICFDYVPFTVSVEGAPNIGSPEWSYNVGAEYNIELANGTTLIPRVGFSFIDEQTTRLVVDPQFDILGERELLNASLTYQNEAWQIQAYATNLNDDVYVDGQNNLNVLMGAPRQYGLRVRRDFN